MATEKLSGIFDEQGVSYKTLYCSKTNSICTRRCTLCRQPPGGTAAVAIMAVNAHAPLLHYCVQTSASNKSTLGAGGREGEGESECVSQHGAEPDGDPVSMISCRSSMAHCHYQGNYRSKIHKLAPSYLYCSCCWPFKDQVTATLLKFCRQPALTMTVLSSFLGPKKQRS